MADQIINPAEDIPPDALDMTTPVDGEEVLPPEPVDPEEVESWFRAAGLTRPEVERHDPVNRGRDLPGTFIASAHRPES